MHTELMSSAVLTASNVTTGRKADDLSAGNRIALDALTYALEVEGIPPTETLITEVGGLRAPPRVVSEDVWRKLAYDRGISHGMQDAQKTAFSRSRKKLLKLNMVSTCQGMYWLGAVETSKEKVSEESC